MGTHKIYSGIQGIRDNISGSLYGDCHELLASGTQNLSMSFHGFYKTEQQQQQTNKQTK